MKESVKLTLFNFCDNAILERNLQVNWCLYGFNGQGGSYGRDGVWRDWIATHTGWALFIHFLPSGCQQYLCSRSIFSL